MTENEWTKRAMDFGQKAFDATKIIGGHGIKASKELANDATIFSQAVSRSMKVVLMREPAAQKGRADRRSGIWHSTRAVPDCFEEVESCLNRLDVSGAKLEIKPSVWEMIYAAVWVEKLPKFEPEEHSVQLKLVFKATGLGAAVKYHWSVDDFPKGKVADALVRDINTRLEALIEPSV